MGIPGLAAVVLAGALSAGAVAVVASVGLDDDDPSGSKTTVTRVIDGDTVEIASGEHVRLIGVDTPERGACGFNEATETMRRMVEGREVQLVNPASVQDLDRYDRLLRYVDVEDEDAGFTQIRAGLGVARYDSQDGYGTHPREKRYRDTDRRHEGACEERERLRQHRQQIRDERWHDAKRLARRANIHIRDGETATHVQRRARTVIKERRRARELARQVPKVPAAPTPPAVPAPSFTPSAPSNVFVPPPGWTTDALTPGYTGCRQGYPGGKINGIYVWKPINC